MQRTIILVSLTRGTLDKLVMLNHAHFTKHLNEALNLTVDYSVYRT